MPDLGKTRLNEQTPIFDRLAIEFHIEWAPVQRRQAPLWYEARELIGEGAEWVAAYATELLAFFRAYAWQQVLQFGFLAVAYLAICVGIVLAAR